MAIDITLAANTPTAALELRQAQATPDGSGFATFLVVRSGGLAAALPYFVTRDALREFVQGLDAAMTGAATPARLPARDERSALVIEITPGGAMVVSGQLEEDDDQQMRFRFITDGRGAETLSAALSGLLGAARA